MRTPYSVVIGAHIQLAGKPCHPLRRVIFMRVKAGFRKAESAVIALGYCCDMLGPL
jgi:hypothetical protein